ncbi:MAG: NAD(P)H-hydrate dehydratase [Candidatus Korobacteraceae bacterium]
MKITTAAEMREIDRLTSERFGVPSLTLMENAGTAVATVARLHFTQASRIAIVCGKGNNGGDGFVAARKLHQAGKVVEVLLLADPAELRGDAAQMFARLPLRPLVMRNERELGKELARGLGNAELIVDAILGTGFRPPVTGLYAKAIEAINFAGIPVLAVDIPSGADSDSMSPQLSGPPADAAFATGGAKSQENAVIARADAIVTFTAPRPAHLFGNLTSGPVVVAPIGSPPEAIKSSLNLFAITAADVAPLLAPRAPDANKGRFGHVLVIGGSFGKSGAAAMAGMSALRSGAGLATVATARSALPMVAAHAPELMTEPLSETALGSLGRLALGDLPDIIKGKTVIAIGPGLGHHIETVELVQSIVRTTTVPTVIDADGLNAFEGVADMLDGARRTLVLTPHPGEMARLTGKTVAQVQADRLGVARGFARERSCILVLKGHRSVVALPDGTAWVNPTGNPGMATGGTGDILTGMVAGFLAQFPERAELAVCAAVFLHGLAGDVAREEEGELPMVATDLLHALPASIRRAVQWSRQPLLRIS